MTEQEETKTRYFPPQLSQMLMCTFRFRKSWHISTDSQWQSYTKVLWIQLVKDRLKLIVGKLFTFYFVATTDCGGGAYPALLMNLWHRILDLLIETKILSGQHKSYLLYLNHLFVYQGLMKCWMIITMRRQLRHRNPNLFLILKTLEILNF